MRRVAVSSMRLGWIMIILTVVQAVIAARTIVLWRWK